jgi:integrase
MGRLTALGIKAITADGLYPDGNGLYLQATAGKSGTIAKSWLFRFKRDGRERRMGLGPLASVPLADARRARDRAQGLLRDGVDPIAAKAAKKAAGRAEAARAVTFDQYAAIYIDAHAAAWRGARHRQQWTNVLRDYASPVFGKLPIAAVDTAHVLKALEPIWSSKPETANRVRRKVAKILDSARARGLRQDENPARWVGHLDQILPPHGLIRRVRHHPALPFVELPAFMARLSAQEGTAARALAFTILTASRTGEAIGARWHEVDLQTRVWSISAERMKSDRPHRIPLSDAAMGALGKPGNPDDFLFPGDRGPSLSSMAMAMLLRRVGLDVTVHGFRSTFRDWAGDQTMTQREVIEAALAHAVGDAAEQAYRRGDALEKRRELMESWADYCRASR